MRVLIAYDGSPGAEQALSLAESLPWPAGSRLRIVAAVAPTSISVGLPPSGMMPSPGIDAAIRDLYQERVTEATKRLAGREWQVEGAVLDGRPATVLVDEAGRSAADLAIAGSRGHGRVASLLLGSVSAELVDAAPCPVLIARAGRVSRIVLAVDGSAPAEAAASLVETWPIFAGLPIHVLSVTEAMEPVSFGFASPVYHHAAAAHAEFFAEAQARHTRLVEETAARLRAAGRESEPTMRTGAAADEILDLAAEAGADLIVMGTKGQTGLTRMVLGSVARNVLYGSRASVLVVRGPAER